MQPIGQLTLACSLRAIRQYSVVLPVPRTCCSANFLVFISAQTSARNDLLPLLLLLLRTDSQRRKLDEQLLRPLEIFISVARHFALESTAFVDAIVVVVAFVFVVATPQFLCLLQPARFLCSPKQRANAKLFASQPQADTTLSPAASREKNTNSVSNSAPEQQGQQG